MYCYQKWNTAVSCATVSSEGPTRRSVIGPISSNGENTAIFGWFVALLASFHPRGWWDTVPWVSPFIVWFVINWHLKVMKTQLLLPPLYGHAWQFVPMAWTRPVHVPKVFITSWTDLFLLFIEKESTKMAVPCWAQKQTTKQTINFHCFSIDKTAICRHKYLRIFYLVKQTCTFNMVSPLKCLR